MPIKVTGQLRGLRGEGVAEVDVEIHRAVAVAVTAVPLVQSLQGGDVDM